MNRLLCAIILLFNLMALESNAQEAGKMYTYKQIGNKHIISVSTGEEIVKALNLFCEERK